MVSQYKTTVTLDNKTVVLIISTQRAGSTLLKALLAQAPDVSHLPEINFHNYAGIKKAKKIVKLSHKPIIVLKHPMWFQEIFHYPKIPPVYRQKKIILTRDIYNNLHSVKKMLPDAMFIPEPVTNSKWLTNWLVRQYWCRFYQNIFSHPDLTDNDTYWLKYEDLLDDPLKITAELFSFIGSKQKQGVDTYSPPEKTWRWGRDDGGSVIKTFKVQRKKSVKSSDPVLYECINRSDMVKKIRQRIGYTQPV